MRLRYLAILTTIISGCTTSGEKKELTVTTHSDFDRQTSELLKRGNIYYELSDYKNASMTYDTLIRLDSTIGEVYYKKGFSDSKNNDIVKSLECYKKAIEFKYRIADSYYNLGLNQILLDNDSITFDNDPSSPKAIEYFEQCLKSNPDTRTEKDALEMIRAFKKNRKIVL